MCRSVSRFPARTARAFPILERNVRERWHSGHASRQARRPAAALPAAAANATRCELLGGALAGDFVEGDADGHGGVERFHGGVDGNRDDLVAVFADQAAESLAF